MKTPLRRVAEGLRRVRGGPAGTKKPGKPAFFEDPAEGAEGFEKLIRMEKTSPGGKIISSRQFFPFPRTLYIEQTPENPPHLPQVCAKLM